MSPAWSHPDDERLLDGLPWAVGPVCGGCPEAGEPVVTVVLLHGKPRAWCRAHLADKLYWARAANHANPNYRPEQVVEVAP